MSAPRYRNVPLRPETLARLEAVSSAMGLATPDTLAEKILERPEVPVAEVRAQIARAAREAEDLLGVS